VFVFPPVSIFCLLCGHFAKVLFHTLFNQRHSLHTGLQNVRRKRKKNNVQTLSQKDARAIRTFFWNALENAYAHNALILSYFGFGKDEPRFIESQKKGADGSQEG